MSFNSPQSISPIKINRPKKYTLPYISKLANYYNETYGPGNWMFGGSIALYLHGKNRNVITRIPMKNIDISVTQSNYDWTKQIKKYLPTYKNHKSTFEFKNPDLNNVTTNIMKKGTRKGGYVRKYLTIGKRKYPVISLTGLAKGKIKTIQKSNTKNVIIKSKKNLDTLYKIIQKKK